MSASGASDALEVCTETRSKLDLADGDYPGLVVNKTNQFVQINSPIALPTHAHFHAHRISNAQPGINVRRKLTAKSYEIVAWAPAEAVSDCRESIGSVSRKCDLLRKRAEHAGDKLPRVLFNRDPIAKVH